VSELPEPDDTEKPVSKSETPHIDAPQSTPIAEALSRGKRGPADATGSAKGESWIETAKTIVYALLIALVIRTFFLQPFNIPSGSMEGTLLIGDYLFIEKFAYGYSRHSFPFSLPPFSGRVFGHMPQRGDVIVFKMPNRESQDYMSDFIKRVIGLPGDRVQMINGVLYLNDKPVPKVRVQDYVDDEGEHVPQYRETLPGGKSYLVLDAVQNGPEDNTQVFVVPPGNFFMMGDNRDNSDDSRLAVGYVPFEDLEGRAIFRFFSTDGRFWEFWKWRFDRMFTGID
jgi:signal peptidase I